MIKRKMIVIFAMLSVYFYLSGCSKNIPSSYGNIESSYSCMALMPLQNETSFSPMGDLLTGYINLEIYKTGLEEILMPADLNKIFKEDGRVYFPKNFNRPHAIEYAALLGLDGTIYGKITSPDQARSDYQGKKKIVNVELYFMDVSSSKIIWSYNERVSVRPGNYNEDLKKLAKNVMREFLRAGFRYSNAKMPCWDVALTDSLKRLPMVTREMFNTLSSDLAETDEASLWMNLGNIFMTIGKRSLALTQYQKYLKANPASPFRGEVERQVAILNK